MVRTVLLSIALVAFGAISSTGAQELLPDPTGVYRCTGFNPDGTIYSAVVEIKKIDGTYRVMWQLPDDTLVIGVGIVTKDVLAVSYFGGSPAIVVYRKDGTDRLIGEWTVGGQEGAVYSETLTILPGHPPLKVPMEPPSRPSGQEQPAVRPTHIL